MAEGAGGGVDRGEGNKVQVGGLFFSPRGNVIIGDNIEIRDVILMTSGKRVIRARGYTVGTEKKASRIAA